MTIKAQTDSEQSVSELREELDLVAEQRDMLASQLEDALWRERVAECLVRELLYRHSAELVRRTHQRHDQIIIGGARPIIADDLLYLLDLAEGQPRKDRRS